MHCNANKDIAELTVNHRQGILEIASAAMLVFVCTQAAKTFER